MTNPSVSKQMLIEWLNEIPNDVEIAIEVSGSGNPCLVAGDVDDDQWIFDFGTANNEL